ncbi:MAG: RIP metalloprotease RseP [Ktedonobacterales bacterium]
MNPLYYLAAIPVFGLLVIGHEFGHFITAKRAGIRVDEFAIGFPPRLFSFRRGETQYSINLLPLGGYVRMSGENGDVTDEAGNYDPRSFASKSAAKRAAVLLAGVTMNLILAVVLLTVYEAIGQPDYSRVIATVVPGSPAAQSGLKPGDTILSIDGHPVRYFSDITTQLQQDILSASPHAKTVNVVLVIEHKGSDTPITVSVPALIQSTPNKGHLGIGANPNNIVLVRPPIWEAPAHAIGDIGAVVVGTYQGLEAVIRGLVPANQAVTGPVGIVNYIGISASDIPTLGISPILYLSAVLSLNLAIFNLLPIPGLDGGRLLFVLIEVLRRGKRVSPEREGLVHLIGLATLLLLVLLVTINDIGNFGH